MTPTLSRARMLALAGAGIASAVLPVRARADDAAPTTFPFDYIARQIRFPVMLDGHGPLTFLLDSGAAANILFTRAGQRIGLTGGRPTTVIGASGSARAAVAHVGAFVVGPVTLDDQRMLVLDVPLAEALGVDGIVGWELLRRFATTVDFDARKITLWPGPPDAAQLGDAVPIAVREGLPRIAATVEGIAATFDVDTGDRGGISLFGPFVRRNGLLAAIPPRVTVPAANGSDIGGQLRTFDFARGKSMRLGPLAFDAPLYRYIDVTSGVFARTDLAGNLGCAVLDRFLLTFDYARSRMFLRPGRKANDPFVFNRTGLIASATAQGPVVIGVIPRSPAAAAGVEVGDRIAAVAGRSVDGPAGFEFAETAFMGPAGTTLPIRLLRATTQVDVTLALVDLV